MIGIVPIKGAQLQASSVRHAMRQRVEIENGHSFGAFHFHISPGQALPFDDPPCRLALPQLRRASCLMLDMVQIPPMHSKPNS